MHPNPPSSDAYPWYVRLIFWLQKKKYGQILNSALVWGRSPKVFLALSCLYGALERKNSPLTPALRALVIVRVSQLNGCAFCVDLNTATLLQRGVDLEKIQDLSHWQTSERFDGLEKLVLEYVEAVTTTSHVLDGSLQERLRRHFSQEALVDLTALIAFQNMSTKFNNAFGIEPQGFCAVPKPQTRP